MSDLLNDRVTLLFTDIEGSTKLWERHPEAMRAALGRHDAILRSAIEDNCGTVFKTVGDAFYAVFSRPIDAVRAAMRMQRELHAEEWGQVGQIKVRVAVNNGEVEHRGGDYFGPPLNRVARLLSAGHGGQILVFAATADLVREALPPGASLRDMGERRLKDLPGVENIYQIVVDGLPATFPPLRTLEERPHNLPGQVNSLIGREREIEAIRQSMQRAEVRLLTLIGPGGIGKTRLALQAAANLLDDFADGVFFVSLASIGHPSLVTPMIAQTLGVRDTGTKPLLESLKEHLRPKQLLLLLDNFEQVAAAANVIADLLALAPKLKVIVTSRTRLHLYGEQSFPVPPLALPSRKRLPPIDRLVQYEAIRLFLERAVAVKPDFELGIQNAPALVEICHQLDGLPLAIELVAARIRTLPPQVMVTKLESRLKMATGGARNLPRRQKTLRATIEWSFDLLGPSERSHFQRLSVFVGGCTLEAAKVICSSSGDPTLGLMEEIESLLDKSLLRQEQGDGGEPRFVMLETIRDYGLERLRTSGEEAAVRARHAACFLSLAAEVEPLLARLAQTAWMDRLERDHDNLQAALSWERDHGDVANGLRLGMVLWQYWWLRGYFTQGWTQLDALLIKARSSLSAAGRTTLLAKMGELARAQGNYAKARSCIMESLSIAQEIQDQKGVATALRELGRMALEEGDLVAARHPLEESLRMQRELSERAGAALSLSFLGSLHTLQGEFRAAHTALGESLNIARELGNQPGMAVSLMLLGRLAQAEGSYGVARSLWQESAALFWQAGPRSGIAYVLEGLADVAISQGHPERGICVAGAAAALRQRISAPQVPALCAAYERQLTAARQALSQLAATQAWESGWAMATEEAVDYAFEGD